MRKDPGGSGALQRRGGVRRHRGRSLPVSAAAGHLRLHEHPRVHRHPLEQLGRYLHIAAAGARKDQARGHGPPVRPAACYRQADRRDEGGFRGQSGRLGGQVVADSHPPTPMFCMQRVPACE
eukprot:7948356-Alexandrium_andersonii.AAC.1